MSLKRTSIRQLLVQTSPVTPLTWEPDVPRTCHRLKLLLCLTALFVLGEGLPAKSADAANMYRAFYYNAQGRLLQVEQVPDSAIAGRVLQNPNSMSFPALTPQVTPLVTGTNKRMSKFATVAVYYKYVGAEPAQNAPNVPAVPVYVEDLQWVKDRVLAVCLPRIGTDPCYYPARCHCSLVGCCCY